MTGFKKFLIEKTGGGAEAGSYEIVNTPLPVAKQLAYDTYLNNHTVSPMKIMPNFDQNYLFAQRMAGLGKTQRKDMPVIRRSDAFALQRRLARGALDVKAPFAKGTDEHNPFPEGLSGAQAQKFLTNGFRDGKISDDVVKFHADLKPAGSLKPIQQQIYVDKALSFGLKWHLDDFQKMVATSFMISSADNFIIDGHHRWLFALLVNPNIRMSTLVIDLPLNELLKLLTAYGDAIGNKRNQ
jgi:hypothetical protein